MAKKKHRSNNNNVRERDNKSIASTSLLTRTTYSLLSDLEDRRTYSPTRNYYAKGLSKKAAHITVGNVLRPSRSKKGGLSHGFAFAKPSNVAVCVRRHRRREVLFALRKTGKGSRSRRSRNAFSDVSC